MTTGTVARSSHEHGSSSPTGKPRLVGKRRSAASADVRQIPIGEIHPSPLNDKLYKPISRTDPEIRRLARSIAEEGLLEPLLLTRDLRVISGHRRLTAALLAGLKTLPCRIREDVHHGDEKFLNLLREANRQRVKTLDERVREEVVSFDPAVAHKALVEHREQAARSVLAGDDPRFSNIELRAVQGRSAISVGKRPMLEAAQHVVTSLREYWPLSDRQVHYQLLNLVLLRHASKPSSLYRNDRQSYQDLTDILTRARLTGEIPWQAIADPTRKFDSWSLDLEVGGFVRRSLTWFLRNYRRSLLQSQPVHIEIVAEKLTVAGVLSPVARRYTAPLTIGRGYCSIEPRYKMAQRFLASGKEKLVLLIISDFDPDGEEIAHSFARSLRDDFGIDQIQPIKVGLTARQVTDLRLPPMMEAKRSSGNFDRFVGQHGHAVYELESVPPATLQQLLEDAIEGVLDRALFDAEAQREREDAAQLEHYRQLVRISLGGRLFSDGEPNGKEQA